MQTNLKDALKNADGIKSPLGDVACYSLNFAELAQEVNVYIGRQQSQIYMAGICATCTNNLG
jgi:hypothetical protein